MTAASKSNMALASGATLRLNTRPAAMLGERGTEEIGAVVTSNARRAGSWPAFGLDTSQAACRPNLCLVVASVFDRLALGTTEDHGSNKVAPRTRHGISGIGPGRLLMKLDYRLASPAQAPADCRE